MRIPPEDRTTRNWLDSALLLTLVATPALHGWLAPIASAVLVALFLARRPSRRDVLIVATGVGLAALLMLGELAIGRSAADPARLARRAGEGFEHIWEGLDASADRAADDLAGESGPLLDSDEAFQILARRISQERDARLTLLLVGPRGQVAAWAGRGLLHDLEGRALPGEGNDLLSSFSAASLLSIRSLEEDSSGWRIVAGASFSVDRLPFGPDRNSGDGHLAWLALPAGSETPPDFVAVPLEGRPEVVVEEAVIQTSTNLQRVAWALVGTTLAFLAIWGEGHRRSPLIGLGAAIGLSLALGLGAGLVALAAGISVLGYFLWTRPVPVLSDSVAAAIGAASGIVVASLGHLVQGLSGPRDLGSGLWPSPEALILRLVLFGIVISLLGLARHSMAGEANTAARLLWTALISLGLAAAAHETPLVALPLLAIAGASTALWLRRDETRGTLRSVVFISILAALISAVGWETAYREAQKREVAGPILAATGPPASTELVSISTRIERHFSRIDLESLAPSGPEGLEAQDLAYEIWRHSPLARGGVLSAVSISLPDGGRSAFSFGIPTTDEGFVDWSPARWDTLGLPVWDSFVIAGEEFLRFEGRIWGRVRFWQLLRPGFRLDEPIRQDLAVRLLRGDPEGSLPLAGLPGPTHYALYSPTGRARISPWKTAPRIGPELQPSGSGTLVTPEGRARAFTATDDDGLRALFFQELAPLGALERVGAHSLGLLIALGALVSIWWLIGSSWSGRFEKTRLALRSYSKRIVLVYSLLALVPMLVVNVVFVRVTSERLEREQLAEGTAAIESAQRVLGEYLLSLEPGFGIDSALDNELLGWLSSVVQHEVNLYWRSSIWASSRPELFTAGLLPARIPGEIHLKLSRGDELGARTNRTGDAEYLELYAPLRVPGMAAEEEVRLVMSTPLLAQQEELAEDLASLRLRTLLATTFLVLLLAGIGARLARSFSDPLMEVVEGTQRIAAGETSLDLSPTETELATLVGAIDRMAARIAKARAELLSEKRLVESMVESITSGVVSLDVDRRVMLRNRVAHELLGVEVGEPLESALARREDLSPIQEFLATAGERIERRTVPFVDAAGTEREWSLVWVPLAGSGEPIALMVVEDITEVLQGQRLEAWAEMARIIAHEIKNPLTPIRLTTEHMQEVHRRDPDQFDEIFESCTTNILRQVGELQQISSEFSTYSRIPRIEMETGDLTQAIREVVEGYHAAPSSGVTVTFASSPETVIAAFDARLLGRAVRNLLENALRASPTGGVVRVRVEADESQAVIAVVDDGPGVEKDLLARIFDPYFSTHDSGTGLGLPIASRIAEEHGGRIAARNRPARGLEVEITLPLG